MSLIVETVQTEGNDELSYLIGDESAGVAAVIDPRADVDVYIELARKRNVSITHIFESNTHADLLSGALELCNRVPSAKIYVSAERGVKYDFDCVTVKDGDSFQLGKLTLTARHSPGHNPEHISFEAAEKKHAPKR